MNVSLRDFLGCSYNHGDYITVLKNESIRNVLWEGKFETIDNHIDWDIYDSKVAKWGIENNGIVIYVDYYK